MFPHLYGWFMLVLKWSMNFGRRRLCLPASAMYISYKHTYTPTQELDANTIHIFCSLLSISFDYVHFRIKYAGKNVLLRNESNSVDFRRVRRTILVLAHNFIARLS